MSFLSNLVADPQGYDLDEAPQQEGGGPLLIEASINLSNILEVDEKHQLITLETSLRLYWVDKRIKPKMKALR